MAESPAQATGKRNRWITAGLVATGCLLVMLAFGLGLAGLSAATIPAYLGTSALVLSLVHRWSRIRSYLILLSGCVVGFFFFAVLHNLFYALGSLYHGFDIFRWALTALEVAAFVLTIIVCPTAAILAALGATVLGLKQLLRGQAGGSPA